MDLAKFGELTAKLGLELSADEIAAAAAQAKEMAEAAADDVAAMLGDKPGLPYLDEAVAWAGCGPFSLAPVGESTDFVIGGSVAPGYEGVREAFAANFRAGRERDAQLVVYKGAEIVVDLFGSNAEASTAPESGYNGDTLQIVYSSGKAIAATVMAMAVDRGLLAYDDRVAKHWPEFAANGKEWITVADVLRHDAGLASFHEAITAADIEDQHNVSPA
jgi:CubicO group peptidase (beta-lactamase class C family)